MPLLFAGGEDSDFVQHGTDANVVTTAGHYRSGYARCALQPALPVDYYRTPANAFSASSLWLTARVFVEIVTNIQNATNDALRFIDASGITRLRLRSALSGTTNFAACPFVVEKLDSSGTATQLGSSFFFPVTDNTLFKFDINFVDAVAGSVVIYAGPSTGLSQSVVYSFSGDTTTNGVSTVTGFDLASGIVRAFSTATLEWSEVICHTASTLAMSLASGAPVANGNTHNFTSAAATNVNPVVMNLATPDVSAVAGQLDQYTTSAIPAGSFSVRSVVVSGTSAKGTTGPANQQWNVRTGGVDYFSPNVALSPLNTPVPTQYAWDLNPNTGVSWQTSQVGNAAGFNFGAESVI